MSIKSKKSLYEECSEIIEKSYSARSGSNDSLSCDEEDECLARVLMSKMTPAVLSKLRRSFNRTRQRKRDADIDRKVEAVMRAAAAEEGIEFAPSRALPDDPRWLHREGFLTAIDNVFGHHKYAVHATKLFQLLDPFSVGKVWWRQLLERLVVVGAKKTRSRVDVWDAAADGGMRRLAHCKRETIVKLVDIEKEDSFCYAAVSRAGRVGVYSGDFKLLNSYELFFHRTKEQRRMKNCWITDALYLKDVQCLLISASDRSLTVYDASTPHHSPLYCVTGVPYIPTCLAYSPAAFVGGSSELVFGNERGDLTRIRFIQPKISLFHTKSCDNINYFFWMELSAAPHSSYCTITTWRRVHSRSVRRVCYIRDGEIILSCSHDSTVSVRAKHAPGKLEDYIFKVQRGVTCFHVMSSLHLLVTGSCDGLVRLWETTQAVPFAVLATPAGSAVLDVAVLAAREIWLHIWDMYEECLLQTVRIKFPFLGVLGKKVEFGSYSIYPGPARTILSDEESSEFPLDSVSRRGSSVYQGSTGGLMLLPEPKPDSWLTRGLEQELDYIRYDRAEILVTCCDHVFVLRFGLALAPPRPPPADTLSARKPDDWDFAYYEIARAPSSTASPPPPARSPAPPAPRAPPTHAQPDLDQLIENAGLQGILEKDFVLMQGLKCELNKKLAEMEANKQTMCTAVRMRAPYLALRVHEPAALAAGDERRGQYSEALSLFPAPSAGATPAASETSTPRYNKPS